MLELTTTAEEFRERAAAIEEQVERIRETLGEDGRAICGLSGGFVVSWFPYVLIGLVSAAARISARSFEAPASSRSDASRLMKSVAPAA